MRFIRATIRFVLFFLLTFGVHAPWRNPLKRNERFWREWIFRNWAHGFVWLLGMKIRVVGNVPKPPFFLVCNHLSYVDIAALRSVCDTIFVAKADVRGWFLAGKMVADIGTIFINRENRRDIPRAGREITEALQRGEGVTVFPEGTSWNGEKILPFNSSFLEFAAKQNLPVHFASIRYETPEKEQVAAESVAWWRLESGFGEHLFELFKIPRFDCEINFGEAPILAENRKELAGKLHHGVKEIFTPMPQDRKSLIPIKEVNSPRLSG